MLIFNGNIRDYPHFKTDFIKLVQAQIHNQEAAAYILKSCLTEIAYNLVKNVDDNLDEMWKQLDDRYGRTSKLTESITYDITRRKPIKEEDEKRFVEFADLIERGHHDLAHMKVEHELLITTVISLLEEKHPKNIRRDWSKRVNEKDNKIDDTNRFPAFLNFLLEQKRIIEHESADTRMRRMGISGHTYHLQNNKEQKSEGSDTTARNPRCLVHGSNTNTTTNCRAYAEKNSSRKGGVTQIKKGMLVMLKRNRCIVDSAYDKYHQAHVDGITFHAATVMDKSKDSKSVSCLLQLMRVNSGTSPSIGLNVLWDGEATISLITFSKAREMGLVGNPVKMAVIKVDGEKQEL